MRLSFYRQMRSAVLLGVSCGLLASYGCGRRGRAETPRAVDETPITFTLEETSEKIGIQFIHNNGAFGAKLLPETMGSGFAFLDYDQDLDQDLFIVNGRDWTTAEIEAFKSGAGTEMASSLPPQISRRGSTCRLYQNNGNGTYTDVTSGSGIEIPMTGMGASVGDFDGNAKPDIYVTAVGRNYLFRNAGPGQFQEIADKAGVRASGWSTGSAFLDFDRDGRLDLFVCRYVEWSPQSDIFNTVDGKNKAYTTPEQYAGLSSTLYQNIGNSRFTDVTVKAGIAKGKDGSLLPGKSLGVAVCDYDSNGFPDVAVANDTEPNYLFRNNGDGTFSELGRETGIAVSTSGTARAARGVDSGDLFGTGREWLMFGNFSHQMLALYRNPGEVFVDVSPDSEVGRASFPMLTFGACFADMDNDGLLDIYTVNGHLDEVIEGVQKDVKFKQRPLLFKNLGDAGFREIGARVGGTFAMPLIGRGAAYADIDLDGDIDLAATTNGGPFRLFLNNGGSEANALRISLEGTRSNALGIGALIEVRTGGSIIRRRVKSGSSYLSQSELPVTMGLGQALSADAVTVNWPSGEVTNLKDVSAGQFITVREGSGLIASQPFRRVRR